MDEIERLQMENRQLYKDKTAMTKIIGGAEGLLKTISLCYCHNGDVKVCDIVPLDMIAEWQKDVDKFFKVDK